jgi:dihydroxyacetone kinase-like predicted kinase
MNPEEELDEVEVAMSNSTHDVRSVELTVATRSVVIDEVEVEDGQIIGLLDGKLTVASSDLESALIGILEETEIEDAELVTFYSGEDLSESDASDLAEIIRQRWSNLEVEILDGGQPHYPLILSVE